MASNGSPRILITRLSHIGDCVLTMPIVAALRRSFPKAFVAWAVEKPADQLIGRHTDLDEVIVIRRGWLSKPTEILQVRRQLRDYRFDVAIDPQGLCKSAILGWLSGARKRIGLAGHLGRELSKVFNNVLVQTRRPHVVDRTLELLGALGIADRRVEFKMPLMTDALKYVDAFLRQKNQASFAVLNPGAIWSSKMWEMDRFGLVAQHLYGAHGVRSIIPWAGEREKQLAQSVVRFSDGCALLAPETSLPQLVALLFRACLYIGCDTGPTHIAVSVGTPCIGLYGTTQPLQSGAYGAQNILLQRRYHGGTTRERRHAANDCMREIDVADVVRACDLLIDRIQRTSQSSFAA